MAIQMRRGSLANYDKSKMLAGEWGVSIDQDTNDQKVFIAFAPGVDKEVMFVEDAEEQIAEATAEAIADATEQAKAWAKGDSFHVNDYASGDGTTTSFTLTETPTSVQGVYVDGSETTAYTLSGSTITFTEAPPSGQNNIRVAYTVNTATDNAKYYKEQAATSASNASNSATSASNNALKSEGYAVGKQNGTDVGSGSDYYHNNAKYYKEEAASSASSAADGEAWAVGKRGGTDVPSTDPTYHNNAKYYKEQAEAAAAMLDAEKILGNFATYQATTTAIKAYKVGEFLTYNGYLYRVTTAIASGGTITPGTNCVLTNVGDEMANRRLWFKNVDVYAVTSGYIIDLQDSRITSDYILEGNSITWGDSSKITEVTNWSTDTAGHFIVTGTCSAVTTATFALVKADQQIVNS